MNLALQKQAIELTEEIMRTYYCKRDIYGVLAHMAFDASWIGPGEREKKYTLEEIQTYFEAGKDSIPSCEILNPDLRAVDLGENICLVTGSLTIRTTPESKLMLEVDQRVSFTYRYSGGIFQVVHMHVSNPYGEMNREEYFPLKMGSQSYDYFQRLLKEKTEVIDMIAGNINGGLKGSNDDSMFSYFYVNEGLPRMLDYTYEEFMQKTGGTAVGAVYPPDLPGALEDCVRCFAQGSVYSTEYRMEKKDGSLIWVLDSGRKALDSEGITRINSIVTDITPLKQALFELEVERERYRIALENITGAMCEYDIANDLFTVYWKANEDEGLKELDFTDFSKTVHSGTSVHPKDAEAFLNRCAGRCSNLLEFRTRFLRPDHPWRWAQFNCSIISDSAGTPVRTIGILKDITDEKQQNLKLIEQAQRDGLTKLLNQTAVRESIQNYLDSHDSQISPGALLMIDLDHFKDVNDSNGHLYGNEVLIETARIIENAAGTGSITGRTGGDEFIVLIKQGKPQKAIQLAENILRQVSEIGKDRNFPISCSLGIACLSECGENYTQLFNRADHALYQAKNNGRNQWAIDTGQ